MMKLNKGQRSSLAAIAVSMFVTTLSFQNCSRNYITMGPGGLSLNSEGASGPTGSLPASVQQPIPVAIGGTITDLKIENTAGVDQTNVPVTIGHVFAIGSLMAADQVVGKLSDGTLLPMQIDAKATHKDGSVRHAILSFIVPKLTATQTLVINLTKAAGSKPSSSLTPQILANANFSARIKVTLGGVVYAAAAEDALRAGNVKSWISGSIADEWLVVMPLKTAAGAEHPHLSARFYVRAFAGQSTGKVDVVLENNWAYEPGPQNFTYNMEINVGGNNGLTIANLKHDHHARWKKSFWWGITPQVNVRQNTNYIIQTRAVPNYDQTIPVSEAKLTAMKSAMTTNNFGIMGNGTIVPYMPTTGGREDIGLMPAWNVIYLLSMDPRAAKMALGNGDVGGSWPAHYRDRKTDKPLSVIDWPYSTLYAGEGDTVNPATNLKESFPSCGGDCSSDFSPDISHLPNMAYFPYVMTGDYYYLEELQFWATYCVFAQNPAYRQHEKGLIAPEQLRGQAWSLRLLGEAAYITPDNDGMKNYFNKITQNNLDYYNAGYTDNVSANKLGVIIDGSSIAYNNGTGAAPWMDDHFTSAVGHMADLGFADAKKLLAYKAKFSTLRMTGAGACWIWGATYTMTVRDTDSSPIFTTIDEVYKKSIDANVLATSCASAEMAVAMGAQSAGDMKGYSEDTMGFPSNMQPALAYGVDSGISGSLQAWNLFMSRTVKPDYSVGPQFSIVPRR